MGDLPIKFQEHLQLTSLGIQPESICFTNCTLESDRFICVRQQEGGQSQVIIVDLNERDAVLRRPISAESAIMHPKEMIIALKAQRTLQIFNLEFKQKIKSYSMPDDVVFWTWLNERLLGLVTESSIYHWDMQDESQTAPVKFADRHISLQNNQLIDYRLHPDEKWSVLVGISQQGGRVVGAMQLYSKERNVSQPIEGNAAAFAKLRLDGASKDTQLFTFTVRTATGAKLHIVEIDHPADNPVFQKRAVDVFFPPEASSDFPVSVQVSEKYGIIFMVTKYGFIHLYDLETGTCIYMNRISSETIFTATTHHETSGMLCINRKGQVLTVSADESKIIPYIINNLSNAGLAVSLASRASLPGADDIYVTQFERLFSQGQYNEAAKLAANSPRGILRTPHIIERFKHLPSQEGQLTPIMQYFGILLDKGSLNAQESVELARPVVQQNRKHLLEKWLKEDKLDCTEALGDIVRTIDINIALEIYLKSNSPHKVVAAFTETGQFDRIVPYSRKIGYTPDFAALLHHIVRVNPDQSAEFATQLADPQNEMHVDIDKIVDVFMGQNMVQQATAFLLDAIKDNLPEHGHLQTRLLEMNLQTAPQVADAILGNNMFSFFDHPKIAELCEKVGLLQRALELFTEPTDIKRVIVHTNQLDADWIVEYFGRLSVEQSFMCLQEMLKSNLRQNLQVVVQIAIKYSDLLDPIKLILLFEQYDCSEGLYYYLGSIVNVSQDADVHFKYIQAAVNFGQLQEVLRICRDSHFYNPEKVKSFLKEANLEDQLPLVTVCDRFDMVHDLILYLYKAQQFKFIEVYVQRVNPSQTPIVIGSLLDVDCDESIIKGLLLCVRGQVPIDSLVKEVEKRNRLKLILPYLEIMLDSGSQEPALFNALAKIYIDSNNNPEKFLKENMLYDTLTVGKYCEKRDPYLAFIAYQKGLNDDELLHITNENAMYKHQARYLVTRRDPSLWEKALDEGNVHRRQVVDQITSIAIPESQSPEDVSIAVKAFMNADMPSELIELLEKIILETSPFSDNQNLQNLLILTAIKADKGKVMNFIQRLDKFDTFDIAQIAIDNGLYEEGFEIYKKSADHVAAICVLIEHIVSIDRASTYAEEIDIPEVWSRLGKAQLDGLRISDAIQSYIKADDPNNFAEVIEISTHAGKDEDLIEYLKMARKKLREPLVDSTMLFTYARTNRLHDLKNFLDSMNVASVEDVGDKCYEDKHYEAAKILYSSISCWSKLATTLIFLHEQQQAVDCARKANSVAVWKQVNQACVQQKEFRLAQICGLSLIVHAEELQGLVKHYESEGYVDELIALLEAGLGLERAHMGMFTELAIIYSKYHPNQLMEHLKLFWARINIPKVIAVCEQAHLWSELVFLYVHYDEFDSAALAMMEHAPDAWEHQSFKEIIIKAVNLEIYYKALNFYLSNHPMLLTDLMSALTPKIDVARVVQIFDKSDNIPLIKPFLVAVQHLNNRAVNNAYNDLLIEEEDYKGLRDSVDNFDNIDTIALAKRLEDHDLIFFRQIAANLYRKNKKWGHSIALCKNDQLYEDAIETAAFSDQTDVAEELLHYFVDIGNKECYVAMLYTCYDLLRPDVVQELSWRHDLLDFTMPYLINQTREMYRRLSILERDNEERNKKDREQMQRDGETSVLGSSRLMITGATNTNGYMFQGNA